MILVTNELRKWNKSNQESYKNIYNFSDFLKYKTVNLSFLSHKVTNKLHFVQFSCDLILFLLYFIVNIFHIIIENV